MRVKMLVVTAGAVLAGCATTPPESAAPIASSGRVEQGPTGAVALDPGARDALTLEAALQAFGPADIDRREAAGALLTWRLDDCALILGFARRDDGKMRLDAAESGPRRIGDPPASLERCAAQALARRG